MNFYSLSGSNSEYSLHILELNKLKFLLVRNFPKDRLLRYLPSFEHHEDHANESDEFSAVKKKFKVDPLTRRTSLVPATTSSTTANPTTTTTTMSSNSSGQTSSSTSTSQNPFYTTINSSHYIRNSSMRFDLTFLNNLDFNSIDFILLTSIDDLFLLPFLCHSPKMKARIFSTTPVSQIGYHAIIEFYRLVCERNRHVDSLEHAYFAENEFFDVFERDYDLEINQWVDIFSIEDIKSAFARIETINYHQKLTLEGSDIAIQPFPSGYSIGSCLWQLEHARNTILLCNNAAALQSHHRHPLQLTPIASLANTIDFFFLSACLNTTKPANNANTNNAAIQQNQSEQCLVSFIQKIQELLAQKKQNVVIPIKDGAIFLDLLDILERKFSSFVRHFYVICSSAHPFVSLGNANVDYLNEKLQKKIYSDQPSNPFSAYEVLLKNQMLSVFDDFIQFAQSNKYLTLPAMIQAHTPSIYFIVDSTLRLGNTMQLLKLIDEATPKQEEVSSSLVLIDPYMQHPDVVAPVLGRFRNHAYYVPIDNRMHVNEFTEFITQVNPKNLVYPRKYQEIQIQLDAKKSNQQLSNSSNMSTVVFGNDEAVSLNLYYRGSPGEYQFDREDADAMRKIRFYIGDPKHFPKLQNRIGILSAKFDPIHKKITTISSSVVPELQTGTAVPGSVQSSNEHAMMNNIVQMQLQQELEERKYILMRRKDVEKRKKDTQDTITACSAHMKRIGFFVMKEDNRMNGVDGDFKLIFKHPTSFEIAVIQHTQNVTTVYASSKNLIHDVTTLIKSHMMLLELAPAEQS